MIALKFIDSRKEHFVNFLAKLPLNIANIIFKTIVQSNPAEFLNFLKVNFADILKANLSISTYIHYVNKFLFYSDKANIDIFKIIGDQDKEILLKTFCNIQHWNIRDVGFAEYHLIFKILKYYAPGELPKVAPPLLPVC